MPSLGHVPQSQCLMWTAYCTIQNVSIKYTTGKSQAICIQRSQPSKSRRKTRTTNRFDTILKSTVKSFTFVDQLLW